MTDHVLQSTESAQGSEFRSPQSDRASNSHQSPTHALTTYFSREDKLPYCIKWQCLRRATYIVARERSIHRVIRSFVRPMPSQSPDPTLSRRVTVVKRDQLCISGPVPIGTICDDAGAEAQDGMLGDCTHYLEAWELLQGHAHASSRSRNPVRHAASASVSVIALRIC